VRALNCVVAALERLEEAREILRDAYEWEAIRPVADARERTRKAAQDLLGQSPLSTIEEVQGAT
jgi:hypothetical protein